MTNSEPRQTSLTGVLPTEPGARKNVPMARGLLDYFPNALAAVAYVSYIGNKQHNPGEELHWAKEKSTDHADCIMRHLLDRGKLDSDGIRHSAKLAWRALAALEIEIENEAERIISVAIPAANILMRRQEEDLSDGKPGPW